MAKLTVVLRGAHRAGSGERELEGRGGGEEERQRPGV